MFQLCRNRNTNRQILVNTPNSLVLSTFVLLPVPGVHFVKRAEIVNGTVVALSHRFGIPKTLSHRLTKIDGNLGRVKTVPFFSPLRYGCITIYYSALFK